MEICNVHGLQNMLKLSHQQLTLTEIFQMTRKGGNNGEVTVTVNQISFVTGVWGKELRSRKTLYVSLVESIYVI